MYEKIVSDLKSLVYVEMDESHGNWSTEDYQNIILDIILLIFLSKKFEIFYYELIDEGLGFEEDKTNRILFLIRNHSTIIDLNNINEKNIELYQKLLNVQYCDTKAYNPQKIEPVLQRLNKIQEGLNKISEKFLENSNEER